MHSLLIFLFLPSCLCGSDKLQFHFLLLPRFLSLKAGRTVGGPLDLSLPPLESLEFSALGLTLLGAVSRCLSRNSAMDDSIGDSSVSPCLGPQLSGLNTSLAHSSSVSSNGGFCMGSSFPFLLSSPFPPPSLPPAPPLSPYTPASSPKLSPDQAGVVTYCQGRMLASGGGCFLFYLHSSRRVSHPPEFTIPWESGLRLGGVGLVFAKCWETELQRL